MAGPDSPEGGALNAAISETVVRLMAEAAGRGPTKGTHHDSTAISSSSSSKTP